MEIISTNIDDSSTIELYWQDEVRLDLDIAIQHIRFGKQEIDDYVNNTSKPDIMNYTDNNAKPIILQTVKNTVEPLVIRSEEAASEAETSAELSKQYANNKINQTHITNCITEIPQDIKLELNGGKLTLKAGSKVYVPNGVNRFDEVVVKSDVSQVAEQLSGTNKWLLCVNQNGSGIFPRVLTNCVSGAGVTAKAGWAYDTTANLINWYSASGEKQSGNFSLPVCIFSTTDGVPTSINKVFNGFGYIGSTVFALPGVKGLIPNGRNNDGSLKNEEFTASKVLTVAAYNSKYNMNAGNLAPAYSTNYAEQEEQPSFANGNWYQPRTNRMYLIQNGVATPTNIAYVLDLSATGGKATDINPKLPFRAVDYNEYADIKDYIVERGISGNQWYELYYSKRLRQGGYSQSGTITFLKPYTNLNYILINGSNKSTTGFSAGTSAVDWIADGQGV